MLFYTMFLADSLLIPIKLSYELTCVIYKLDNEFNRIGLFLLTGLLLFVYLSIVDSLKQLQKQNHK